MTARSGLLLRAALAASLLALPVTEAAPAQQATPAIPTFRTGIDTVALDVVVLDRRGEAIENLAQDEFEVLEDGIRRPITTFTVVKFSDRTNEPALGDVQTDVAFNNAPEGRLLVIAFDEMANAASPEAHDVILRTRLILREFISSSFGPNDVAAVVLVGRGSVHTGQDFTSSKRRLIDSIDRYSGGFTVDSSNMDVITGRTYDLYLEKNRLASLRDLVEFLATLPAKRKALLYISETLGRVDVGQVLDGGSSAKTLRQFCAERLHPTGPNIVSCDPSQDLHRVLVAAARGNVAIYPINPRGIEGNGRNWDFVDLAAATGGLAATNVNPRPLLQQIARENGAHYRIGFETAHKERDGKMVPIRVNVRRPGTRVLSRSGYVARFPDEKVIEATDTATLSGALASPLATSGIGLRVAAPIFRESGSQGTVAVILEAESRDLLAAVGGTTAGSGEVEVSYLATDVHRKVHKGKRFRVRMTAQPHAALTSSTVRFIMPMTLAPGRYQLRLASEAQGRTGAVVQDVEIPDFEAPLTMSGVMISSTTADKVPTFWPAGRPSSGPMSRMATTRRVFNRDETLTVYGELYLRRSKGQNGNLPLAASLSDAVSTSVRTRQVLDPAQLEKTPAFTLELPLKGVAPGTYVLHVRAGGQDLPEAVQEIPIQVQ
jgi:VWFA-related protein